MSNDVNAEIWRDIDGWPYQISSYGRLMNKRNGYLLRKKATHPYGYINVTLCDKGRKRTAYIHRLVCEAFHGPAPQGKPEVDHIDKNTNNNSAANLRWVSKVANLKNREFHIGESHHGSFLTIGQVKIIRRVSGVTHSELAKITGLSREHIRDICTRRIWTHV